MPPTVSVIVPVFRGEAFLPRLLGALGEQRPTIDELWLVVTDSSDEVAALARAHGARHTAVSGRDFDHAGTRSEAAARASGEVLVFLTQDAVPAHPTTLATLVGALDAEPGIGATYGRQLPDDGADPVAAVKRLFNYPDRSLTKRFGDRTRLGSRTPFISNAFAAYRREALEEVGRFGRRELICEDYRAGAALLAAGWAIRYTADAVVHHTHHFGLAEELRRYFDIGVAHRRHQWILDDFGGSDREGLRYLRTGIGHLRRSGHARRIPGFVVRGAAGRAAYALGRHHELLPRAWCRRLSSMALWWDRAEPATGSG